MNYQQALEYINGFMRFGSKLGLDRIRMLLREMGEPQKKLKFVHVAGTNGKGSTCTAIASVLTKAGYRTGLYTSPYVLEFRERIRINGEMIPEQKLIRAVERIQPSVKKLNDSGEVLTEFEIITALAFDYFVQSGCDVVVLEVGLGGRFDATNVIEKPLVSVITSISYDHVEILGDTLQKIAFEKCGIIKDSVPVVTYPLQEPEALAEIMSNCAIHGSTLIMPSYNAVQVLGESIEGTQIEYKNTQFYIPLAGRHQIANFITAYEAIEVLRTSCGFAIDEEQMKDGFSSVSFVARMEKLHGGPLVLLDGAHNLSGVTSLTDSIERYLKGRRLVVIMGMLKDKDYSHAIAKVSAYADLFIAVSPASPRALPAEAAVEAAAGAAKCDSYAAFDDYAKAFSYAAQNAGAEDVILICGSLYLAGPMRKVVMDYYSITENTNIQSNSK